MELKIERKFTNLRAQTALDGNIIATNGSEIFEIPYPKGDKKMIAEVPTDVARRLLSKSKLLTRALRLGIFQVKNT